MKNKRLYKKADDVSNNSTMIEETINELLEYIEALEDEIETLKYNLSEYKKFEK